MAEPEIPTLEEQRAKVDRWLGEARHYLPRPPDYGLSGNDREALREIDELLQALGPDEQRGRADLLFLRLERLEAIGRDESYLRGAKAECREAARIAWQRDRHDLWLGLQWLDATSLFESGEREASAERLDELKRDLEVVKAERHAEYLHASNSTMLSLLDALENREARRKEKEADAKTRDQRRAFYAEAIAPADLPASHRGLLGELPLQNPLLFVPTGVRALIGWLTLLILITSLLVLLAWAYWRGSAEMSAVVVTAALLSTAFVATRRRTLLALHQRREVRERRWKQGLHVSRQALLLYDGKRCWLVPRDRNTELKPSASSSQVLFDDEDGQRRSLALPFVESPSGSGRFRKRSGLLFRSIQGWIDTGELIRLDSVREPLGLVAREWLLTIGVGHGSLLGVASALIGVAGLVAALVGEPEAQVTGLMLGAPLFLIFVGVPGAFYNAVRRALDRPPRELRGSGYFVALGFAAMWVVIVGSASVAGLVTTLQAEVVDGVRPSDVGRYAGRNAWLEIPGARRAEALPTGYSAQRTEESEMEWWVAPLLGGPTTPDGVPCAWLGTTNAGLEQGQPEHLDLIGGYFKVVVLGTGYRLAIADALGSRSPCPEIVLQPSEAPAIAASTGLRRFWMYNALAHLVPLLALGLWGLGRWDRSWQRPPHDPSVEAVLDERVAIEEVAEPAPVRIKRAMPQGTLFLTTSGVRLVAKTELRFRFKSFLQGGLLLLGAGAVFLLRALGIFFGPPTGPLHAFFMAGFGVACLLMSASLTFQGDIYGAADFRGWKQRFRFAQWRKQLAGTTQLDTESAETLAGRIPDNLRVEIASLVSQGASDVAMALVRELIGADVIVSHKVVEIVAGGVPMPVPDDD